MSTRPSLTPLADLGRLARDRRERPRGRAAKEGDELAAFHCQCFPCFRRERIAQHCCAAGFQFGLFRLWALTMSAARPLFHQEQTFVGTLRTAVSCPRGARRISETTNVRAASMYQASGVEQFAPGRHGYPRASDGPKDRNGGRVSDIAPAMAAKPVSRTITSRLASNSSCAWACSVL